MNPSSEELERRKKELKEKKELKKLEIFMYDRQNTLRESTRRISYQESYRYNSEEHEKDKGIKLKCKRGRKPAKGAKAEKINKSEVKDEVSRRNYLKNGRGNTSVKSESLSCKKNSPSLTDSETETKNNKIAIDLRKYISNGNDDSKDSGKLHNNYQDHIDTDEEFEETVLDLKTPVEENFPCEVANYKRQRNSLDPNAELARQTFINCDLRFFNFDLLTQRIGYFDVIMLDPPWRIKGAQRNDSSFMFSNSKFNLEYNTLANNEILSLPVENLSKKGFCFLWVLNSLMNVGYECLNKWGYDIVDQITWVKMRNEKLYISQGYYFLHSSETCLVGYKCPPNEIVEYKSKIASNIMFANVKGKSQKPDEIYEMIEKMMPGSKKIELFARNNNLREGWFSLGNQLGETFNEWRNVLTCDNCKMNIDIGTKRYKSKLKANYDLCQKCYKNIFQLGFNVGQVINDEHNAGNFFELKNNVNEDVLHHYYACNDCHAEPIWGNRFHCATCDNFDLCEACYDKEMERVNLNTDDVNNYKEKPHIFSHEFKCFEVKVL